MMSQTLAQLREQRLQKLFDDCQRQVFSQIIGPFGLSPAMFSDRDGGNVTTLHNFELDSDQYVAEKDKATYAKSHEEYSQNVENITPLTDEQKKNAEASGIDAYRNKPLKPKENAKPNGRQYEADIDHVKSKKDFWKNKKSHLAFETGAGLDDWSAVINGDENLVATDPGINRSKKAGSLTDFVAAENVSNPSMTNAEYYQLDLESCQSADEKSREYLNSTVSHALIKKQTKELLHTGGMQALQMGGRQALGLLLTELVNGLFNEFKLLIRHGVEIGKTLIQEITERLRRVAISVAKKIPDALSQGLQGGVSGFVSNLLTFLINTFLSTAKRFVTVIREGLLGLYSAFKMIFFPPVHMTSDQALQEGIKILTVVVTTATGILLQEVVKTFVSSMPFLLPIAEALTAVIIGIITGLLSAFLAYQIDSLFDRLRFSHDERMMDQLMADTKGQSEFANGLITLTQSSLDNVRLYSEAVNLNEEITDIIQNSKALSDATLDSLHETVVATESQIKRSWATVEMIEDSQRLIDDFLDEEK